MAYDIPLSNTKAFSTHPAVPYVASWKHIKSAENVKWRQGSANPPNIVINTQIPNYSAFQYFAEFDTFRVTGNLTTGSIGNAGVDFINESGEVFAEPEGHLLSPNALNVTETFAFQNLSLLASGIHNFSMVFGLVLYRPDGSRSTSFGDKFSMKLEVLPPSALILDKSSLNFQHINGNQLPASQAIALQAPGDFTLNVAGDVLVTGSNIVLQSNEDGISTYTGNGDQQINVSLDPIVNGADDGEYSASLTFANSVNSEVVEVSIFVYDEDKLIVDQTALKFRAITGTLAADAQFVRLVAPGNYTIKAPLWLDVSPINGSDLTLLRVRPLSTNNLNAGTYIGLITITYNNVDYYINVEHNVFDSIILGAKDDALNFTDDYATISNFYDRAEYKVNLNIDIDYTQYGLAVVNRESIAFKLGLFNNHAKFFLGKTIKNIMAELEGLSAINLTSLRRLQHLTFINYYNPANTAIKIELAHQNNTALNKVKSFNDVKFLPGRKPNSGFDSSYILNYELEPIRVTPNSIILFNFYKEEAHLVRVYKNEKEILNTNHEPGVNRVFGMLHDCSVHQPGDRIEIRLYKNRDEINAFNFLNNPDNYISQNYLVLPEGKTSYHIAWENEYRVLELMEFTGSATFSSEYSTQTTKNYIDFLEKLNKLSSSRSQSLQINTGFLLKGSTRRIDSLLKSKRAWMISTDENIQPIELVPVSKSFSGRDTDKDLYEYEVEFTINTGNDFKSYS